LNLKLNEPDDKNELPLDLALKSKQESIAKNLVKNHIEINKTDSDGLSLLHKAIQRGKLLILFQMISYFT
jgi:ankyrin repeat protein